MIHRRLFNLAAPIIGINVLNVLAIAVDTAMCGHLPNPEDVLTGLSFATQLVFLLMVAMLGLTVGSVTLISRAWGAQDSERVQHVFRQSVTLTIVLGVGVATLGNALAGPLLSWMGAEGAGLEEGLRYLRPLLLSTTFYYLTILIGAAFRGVGSTRIPFLVALVGNIINVVINYALILGNWGFPSMGVEGAAIGTIAGQCLSVLLLWGWMRSQDIVPGLRLSLRPSSFDLLTQRQLLKVGLPAALDMLILNASFLSIVGMLGRMDGIAVAAHGIGLRIQALAFVPGMSISQATGALVGQALGAKDIEQAKATIRAAIFQCTLVMSLLALGIILFTDEILAIFDVALGTPLSNLSRTWIRVLGYCMPIVGIYLGFVGMLQGAGETRVSLRINAMATLVFQIPLSAILGFGFALGPFGVWVAFPFAFVVKAILGGIVYRKGRWARVGVEV